MCLNFHIIVTLYFFTVFLHSDKDFYTVFFYTGFLHSNKVYYSPIIHKKYWILGHGFVFLCR